MTHGPASHPSPSAPAPAAVRVAVCALTDVGRTREHNEDAFLVADLSEPEPLTFLNDESAVRGHDAVATRGVDAGTEGVLFLVADGLGGAAAGEIASRMGARAVFDALRERVAEASADAGQYAVALRDAVLAANTAIHRHALRHAELRGMGTTLTAAALRGDTLYLAQVGDSRGYLIRDGVAQQLTKDQSLMQKLVEAGEITPEQAETSVRRNIILQALGPEASVKVDLTHQQLRRGDLLLLCSDGLSGQVRAHELAEAAADASDLAALCRELIARANATGGPDNITVVAARFDGAGLVDASQGDAIGHQRFPLGSPTPTTPIEPVSAAVLDAPALALPVPGQAAGLPAEPPPAPGVTPVELAERRDRAKVAYVGLAILAVVLAALLAWRFYSERRI
ncbi:protein phosphatase 2C domain-containing protein [Roseisolibacter sp. H3M3-2]|uniref:protein phosphatase 2C domain-containing protein n=1 Tax=Roseisolibacter sp. H3M3-2 TaxID=3031323 RepID=UPI0023D9B8D2|nr:protein phosphatase 2C domain-containing protein [Roseisolibacter sp. H3M3-2]MDF1505701.1 protein phosphatase 2C domain-containing protein [Roseisolibacter sp. H3M3-2]